ncbi:MAG TPA: glycosyl hydrolase [Solirubrobacteraceae bacterium]|nr:glycosyl hydrolase [Solirubrobacteraceae bacterium]
MPPPARHRRAVPALLLGALLLAALLLAAPLIAGPGADRARGAAVGGPRFTKRGVASARFLARAPAKLAGIGAGWAYDWSATPPPGGRGPQWVPMLWGAGSLTPGALRTLRAARRTGRTHALLGFNEPDSASQSDLSPQRAAALWPALERTGLRLGSPAPAVPTDGWLARFMAIAARRHLRVDFIALHYYQDITDPHAITALHAQLAALHRRYRRPLWITEIGAIDLRAWHEPMQGTPTPAGATAYMRRLFALLDGLPYVQRYAWFTDDCWTHPDCRLGSLFDGRGHLTAAGRTFESAP